MENNYEIGDIITLTMDYKTLSKGTEAIIKRFIGCSCKPYTQGVIVEVDGVEYPIIKFRTKVKKNVKQIK